MRKRPAAAKREVRRTWSEADLTRLRQKIGKQPVDQIAAALRRTPSAVRQKMFELGLRIRAKTPAKAKTRARKQATKPRAASEIPA